MIIDETIELARSHHVEVRLNAAGNGLELDVESDPPRSLLSILRHAKWGIVEALRQQKGLPGLFEPYLPILKAAEASRPPDVDNARWDIAMRGLRAFLAGDQGDEALRLGWPHDELFRVPQLWASIDRCGAALLIGDCEVLSVTAKAIQIKTASGAVQSFYRGPEPDFGLVYRERVKLLVRNVDESEAQARAYDFAVDACRTHTGLGLEDAKRRVLAALGRS